MDRAEEILDSSALEQYSNNDDKELCSFYYKAIKSLLDIGDEANVLCLHRYFKIFDEYYDFWGQVKRIFENHDDVFINLLKDSLYYRIAYIYRSATILSSAVAFHFRNICKVSPRNIENLIMRKLVKICSLGGCSASDIVAVVKVLDSIAIRNGIEMDFRVTIIESDERWKITCLKVLSCLKQFHKASWKITFIPGNPNEKKFWTSETLKAIQEADVVAMIRFFSIIDQEEKIMKEICGNIKSQAVLFILDHPKSEIIELSFGVTNSNDFKLIHLELYDFHSLDIEVLKHFKTLFHKHNIRNQKYFKINLSFNVFVGAWVKISPESDIKCLENIDYIFQKNLEKYNPKQSFLSTKAFTRWEKMFTLEKEAAGWDSKGIRKIVLEEKEKRNNLLAVFIDEKKKLNTLKENLLIKLQLFLKEGKYTLEINDEDFKSYLIQKKIYSEAKKAVYISSFIFY